MKIGERVPLGQAAVVNKDEVPSLDGKGVRLVSGIRRVHLIFHTAFYRYAVSNLLDEKRHTGRRRPVAGPVDRDEGDRVIASLGNVYDGSITGRGVV